MQRHTLTAKETAQYIGIHIDTLYDMVRKKEIPHVKVRRRIFFTKETIDSWMRHQEQSSYEAI